MDGQPGPPSAPALEPLKVIAAAWTQAAISAARGAVLGKNSRKESANVCERE
jgi:hypothetical protein